MKEQYSIWFCLILFIICIDTNVECSEKVTALKNDTINNGLMVNLREINNGRLATGKLSATTKKQISAELKGKQQNNPYNQYNLSKQNRTSGRKSPSKLNQPQYAKHTLETSIIVGNQNSKKAEIYTLRFECTDYGCTPNTVQLRDLVWSSPVTEDISEVKAVLYKGHPAILATISNGAIVYEHPSGKILFKKEFEAALQCNIHSAEVLPDGNVIVACSLQDGRFGVLYKDGNNVIQKNSDTNWITDAPFAHGVVYGKSTNLVYAGGYLTILIMEYKNGMLKVIKTIHIDKYYDEPNKEEDASYEDGIHDMYPIDGDQDHLYVTTGEHAFLFSVKDYSLTKHPTLYTIPSKHSQQNAVAVKDKGGIKAISRDAKTNVVIAKSAPWFKEVTGNYYEKGAVVIWSMPKIAANNGFCHKPDYDLTDKCKIKFHDQLNMFYKVRMYQRNTFSF